MIFAACSIRQSRVILIAPGAHMYQSYINRFPLKAIRKNSDSEVVRLPPHENFIGGIQQPDSFNCEC